MNLSLPSVVPVTLPPTGPIRGETRGRGRMDQHPGDVYRRVSEYY
jgi:hypothetical protein